MDNHFTPKHSTQKDKSVKGVKNDKVCLNCLRKHHLSPSDEPRQDAEDKNKNTLKKDFHDKRIEYFEPEKKDYEIDRP